MADDDSLLTRSCRWPPTRTDTDLGADPFFVASPGGRGGGSLNTETLARRPSGLTAYLDEWWNELSTLAGDDPTGSACAGTFRQPGSGTGSDRRNDLKQVNPSLHATVAGTVTLWQPCSAKARRMIFGNEEDGYALISQRLRTTSRPRSVRESEE